MGFSIDIDTGGTFTDGVVRGNGITHLVKVPTTPHDLTLCFIDCIEEAARSFGYQSASQLLVQTDTVRLSTTIGTNALINASGPKLGLLVTKAVGDNAYAPIGTKNVSVDFLVPKDMIIGIDEEMSAAGIPLRAPAATEVLAAVKTLLERGARRIVVSLARASLNPAHERQCREIILADYPAHYLGTVPLLLSTEVSSETDDQYRTNAALIDAYIHHDMARYLYKADEDVRNRRFKRPLLIVHATGGVCRVAKTKAIDTCDSGPAAGIFGAAFVSRLYGMDNVVTVDVGGTSTDIGLTSHGEPSYIMEREFGGVPVREHAIETVSIGGGGSSIVRVDRKTKQLHVGPESAGGIPGPACFGLGGANPCVTDAWVTLGYIDPEYFLGGRRKLDVTKARDMIRRRAADLLGLTVEQAADAIVKQMTAQCAQFVKDFVTAKKVAAKDVTMFAIGGGGGLSCSGMAKAAGIPRIYFFPFGAQFCAFGSSCTDVVHDYSVAKNLPFELDSRGSIIQAFNVAVAEMKENAFLDMQGEGFEKENVSLALEVVMTSQRSPSPTVVRWSPIFLKGKEDIEDLSDLYRARATCGPDDKLVLKELRLRASYHLADPEFPRYDSVGESPRKALKGVRSAYWDGKFQEAHVYEQSLLESGNIVRGLAFVESVSTTILVPPGSRYVTDHHLNGVMEEE